MSYTSSFARYLDRELDPPPPRTTYFSLMELVGDAGHYQSLLVILFFLTWFSTGIILLSTAFLFRLRSLSCQTNGIAISSSTCGEMVCSLPEEYWHRYVSSD